jgi:hypothetical protein
MEKEVLNQKLLLKEEEPDFNYDLTHVERIESEDEDEDGDNVICLKDPLDKLNLNTKDVDLAVDFDLNTNAMADTNNVLKTIIQEKDIRIDALERKVNMMTLERSTILQ